MASSLNTTNFIFKRNYEHELKIILPIGISFYTFQTLGYTIDIYKKRMKPERHLGYFALYVTYFPQLVAGPIEKAKRLLILLRKNRGFHISNIEKGLRIILLGLVYKICIADQLNFFLNQYNINQFFNKSYLSILSIFFMSFQVYFDFAGYSLIAIGTSKLFGIRLVDNFKAPYFSNNMREFWRRWHISLFDWLSTYLYIPFLTKSKSKHKGFIGILLVFFVSGLWHGATLPFLIWGILHGILIVIEKIINTKYSISVNKFFSFIYVTISFALINSIIINPELKNFISIYESIFNLSTYKTSDIFLIFNKSDYPVLFLLMLSVFSLEFGILYHKKYITRIGNNFILKPVIYAFLVIMIILFSLNKTAPFYYFQF